jgi:hypothetical protein
VPDFNASLPRSAARVATARNLEQPIGALLDYERYLSIDPVATRSPNQADINRARRD